MVVFDAKSYNDPNKSLNKSKMNNFNELLIENKLKKSIQFADFKTPINIDFEKSVLGNNINPENKPNKIAK